MKSIQTALVIFIFFILNDSNIKSTTAAETTTTTSSPTTTVDDFAVQNEIVNRHDFNYIYNPGYEICKPVDDNKIFVVVYVHTAPGNFKRRLSIRETWSKRSMFRDMRIVFCMGATNDFKTNEMLKLEVGLYNDIVQEDFLDAYRNLTYKGIMAMKWLSTYCNNTKYILKVDDDIITNIFILLRHLKSLDEHNLIKPKTVMCLVWVGMVVMRDKNSKWYLSKDEFKDDVYGKYCSGSAYILTGDLPPSMYDTSWHIKFFWVDDYYITGLLARGVNVTYEFFNSLYIISSNLVDQRFTGKQSDHTVFGHIPNSLNKMYELWNFILKHQLMEHPNLFKTQTSLLSNNDFKYLKDFKWKYEIWDKFIKKPKSLDEMFDEDGLFENGLVMS